ncbi:carotene dioxygenase [Endogone sp. FLAS-F59071]|nr:carotene dioxygenase [Endogone sp. FLAS-F59071]|eukprot:RUS13354.1 carotene dioxygenase [Endogone sp. FLAS-F59071]
MAPAIEIQSNHPGTVNQPTGYKNTPETPMPVEINVTGTLPPWLSGVLYRSGTGKFNIDIPEDNTMYHIQHPFDGLSLVHRFEFSGASNTVKYNSRYTAKGVERRIIKGDKTVLFFGPDPCKTFWGKVTSVFSHIAGMTDVRDRQDDDPSSEIINVAVSPNFPLPKGERFEGLGDQGLVVKTDANMVQVLDDVTLEPIKIFTYGDFESSVIGQLSAAHHQEDVNTNENINFVLELGPFMQFHVFSVSPSGETTPFDTIHENLAEPDEPLKPSYVHSFSMTEKYIVIPNYPYWFSYRGFATLWHGSVYESFHWDGTRPTLFHVLDRQTKKHVATYEGDAYFAFHTVNAWDEVGNDGDNVIVFDVCAYDSAEIIDASFGLGKGPAVEDVEEAKRLESAPRKPALNSRPKPLAEIETTNKNHLSAPSGLTTPPTTPTTPTEKQVSTEEQPTPLLKPAVRPSEVRRYRLESIQKVETAQDSDSAYTKYKRPHADYTIVAEDVELPRIDPRRAQRPYRYVYGVCDSEYSMSYANASSAGLLVGIIKADLYNGTKAVLKWDQPGCSCSEPVFVPDPSKDEEDAGVLLSIVNVSGEDGQGDSCFMLVLDARDLAELARADMGAYNASTFHGSFVDAAGKSVAVN